MFKQRLISSIFIILFFVPLLIFSNIPFLLNAVVAVLAVIATYELLISTKYIEGKPLFIVAATIAAVMQFLPELGRRSLTGGVIFIAICIFTLGMIHFGKYSLEHITISLFLTSVYAYFFSTLIFIRRMELGEFLIFFVFVGAWTTDTGAYLVGSALGKHKLIEKISPKKSIEGAIGAVFVCALCFLLTAFIMSTFFNVKTNYIGFAILGAVTSVVAQFGDLSASLIKRTFKVKDFGTLLPGHGGVMDRFDSVLFVAPFLYVVFSKIDLIFPV
ncbi:MAG: hypothetical protein E7480_03135 [Ruminococcaceae bacterium]|nr:hypothetical protein [Oscillospiraceae bacterium]